MKPTLSLGALSAALLAARIAHAQPTTPACPSPDALEREVAAREGPDALLRYGRDLRVLRCEAESLRPLEAIPDAARSPEAHAQIGSAHQALGNWVQAEASMRRAMAASADPWVAQHRARMERAYGEIQRRVGRLELLGGVQGAEVRINGEPRGRLPLPEPLIVVAGTHTLQVIAPHYFPITINVVVGASLTSRESIVMRRVDEVPNVPIPIPRTELVSEGPAVTPASARLREDRAGLSPWFWVAGVGAVAFAGASVAGFVMADGAATDFNAVGSGCASPDVVAPSDAGQPQACRALASRRDLGLALGIGGAALGALSLGATLWIGAAHTASRSVARAPLCAPTGPASLSCAWRF
jgi:hypothetical protein